MKFDLPAWNYLKFSSEIKPRVTQISISRKQSQMHKNNKKIYLYETNLRHQTKFNQTGIKSTNPSWPYRKYNLFMRLCFKIWLVLFWNLFYYLKLSKISCALRGELGEHLRNYLSQGKIATQSQTTKITQPHRKKQILRKITLLIWLMLQNLFYYLRLFKFETKI